MCVHIYTILLLLLGYVTIFFEELEYICGDTLFCICISHGMMGIEKKILCLKIWSLYRRPVWPIILENSQNSSFGCYLLHKISVFALLVARHISRRYSTSVHVFRRILWVPSRCNTVIPRLTKIIRSGITFVSRNVISLWFL